MTERLPAVSQRRRDCWMVERGRLQPREAFDSSLRCGMLPARQAKEARVSTYFLARARGPISRRFIELRHTLHCFSRALEKDVTQARRMPLRIERCAFSFDARALLTIEVDDYI